MSPEEYVRDRLDAEIAWYSRKSQYSQSWFKRLRVIEILLAATIPLVVGYISPQTEVLKLVVGTMGVVVAFISGLVTLSRFQENWLEYRTVAETLKHEKYLYLTQSAPYDGEAPFRLLVERVEARFRRKIRTGRK
jgi:hypothetical protein